MKLLIKSATIVDKQSDYHLKQADILIQDGIIKKIGNAIEVEADKEINIKGLHVSQGWLDTSVSFGEPGYEERETIENGLRTAAFSGFTDVVLNAQSKPTIDNSSTIYSVKAKAQGNAVNLLPTGTLTVASKGVDLAELYDMGNAGAVSFGDYKKPVSNPNLLKIALQYAQNFGGLVQSFPLEKRIAGKGIVNEHHNSTLLGLKGIPNLAEDLQIARDLYLLEYTGGKLHIPTISTEKSVALIKEAKKKGLDITCSVAIHNLVLTDDLLSEFDTRAKVMPPLRTKKDTKALIKALKDGVIDFVTSDHDPIDIENKKVEFDNANYGSIGLESAFGALQTIFSTEETVAILTRDKERFKAEISTLAEQKLAKLSFFLPEEKYTFEKSDILSISQNSIFLGQQLKGKAIGIFNNNQLIISEEF
ncbi:dihydroorotase [Zunongwangia endophytica]|uniref:Dihydroorotase family protein n=1 Tax=Zunongwangia endophytica TaxID=1808945 RepID=A0ABV8H126_9FLAO|nr:dihydroorotase [Zunongwangia endophytica]MDN3594290.1 dihydroorotase [Zunongwangia endophytica]